MSLPRIDESTGSPWSIAYTAYDPGDERRREAILALGNGMMVTRAASTDSHAGDAHYPGTYRAGCYERLISDAAGATEETESLVNLPNWLPLTFRIDGGDWFYLDDVELTDYCHVLDLQAGMTRRAFTFIDNQGRRTRFCERRLVSMADPHLAALRLELTPQNWSGEVELRSAIDASVVNDNVPRYGDYERRHFDVQGCEVISRNQLGLQVRTRCSQVNIAQAVRTFVDSKSAADYTVVEGSASIANHIHCAGAAGETLGVEKVLALYTSDDPGVRDPYAAAKTALAAAGSFSDLCAAHARTWGRLWERADVNAEDESTALTLRFHVFHILQTVSPHSADLDIGVPARGWHGEGYRGHVFWDELFVLPFLYFRFPDLARSLLLYRYRRLDEARTAASKAGHRGAMYPWRSARTGREVTPRHQKNLLSGRWMSDPTRLQRHIGSAVVFNVWHYYLATGDSAFLADYGAEMILEIARFWASIARYDPDSDRYEIKGVIGPDEYHNSYPDRSSPGLDNNAYTNVMAVWSLCRGLEVLDHVPAERREALIQRLGLTRDEFVLWDAISRKMRVVFHDDGIISQFEGFEKLREFSRDLLPPSLVNRRIDWALEAMEESADAYQVTKQADVLTLFYLLPLDEIIDLLARLGYRFSRERLLRTADYYLARTTHRSSLSRVVYAGALAQAAPKRSWHFYRRTLETDLHALKGESIAEGVHLGAMGGTLDILQRRYLGITVRSDGALWFDAAMPPGFGKVHLKLYYRGSTLDVEAFRSRLRVRSRHDSTGSVELVHSGRRMVLIPGGAVVIEKDSAAVIGDFGSA